MGKGTAAKPALHAARCHGDDIGSGARELIRYVTLHAASNADQGDYRADTNADAWALLNGAVPQDATFRLFDRSYGPEPVACDFVFVSESLARGVKRMQIDRHTRASDHQPVHLSL